MIVWKEKFAEPFQYSFYAKIGKINSVFVADKDYTYYNVTSIEEETIDIVGKLIKPKKIELVNTNKILCELALVSKIIRNDNPLYGARSLKGV